MSISQEKFKQMLKEKGLKVTQPEVARIWKSLLHHRDRHMTAEDIYELVKEDYPEIGLATIYRTVQLVARDAVGGSVSIWMTDVCDMRLVRHMTERVNHTIITII